MNQRVADEITSLVARHRYGVEAGRDAVRCAEQASAERNAQLRAEAAERRAALPGLRIRADPAARDQEQRNPRRDNEIRLESENEEQSPEPRAPAPRRPVFEDDEDFSAGSWLR